MYLNCSEHFRIAAGQPVDLERFDPDDTAGMAKSDAKKRQKRNQKKILKNQKLLYAGKEHSLLIILQGMDTGGKDGTMEVLLDSMNPKHCKTFFSQAPSKEELSHNFLRRAQMELPARKQVAIWHRSYYEEVLVTRVNGIYDEDEIKKKYGHINNFEDLLHDNNTHVIKFFLYMSPEEQLKRLKERVEKKFWKATKNDFEARLKWDEYQDAYERMMEATSTENAPWYVIPADNKWFRNYAVTQIVAKHLEALDLKTPGPSIDLDEIRAQYLEAEDPKQGTLPGFSAQ